MILLAILVDLLMFLDLLDSAGNQVLTFFLIINTSQVLFIKRLTWLESVDTNLIEHILFKPGLVQNTEIMICRVQ